MDYWDYLKDALKTPITSGPAAFVHAAYNKAYDESHGSDRYYLSKIPVLGTVRNIRDSARKAQDRYDNTGVDEEYIDRVGGVDPLNAVIGDVGRTAGVVHMALSLADMYGFEVMEDVGNPKKPQNIRSGYM